MAAQQELSIIARAMARMMAQADVNAKSVPEIQVGQGAAFTAAFALTEEVAHFTIDTLFGYPVRVTVSKAEGIFG